MTLTSAILLLLMTRCCFCNAWWTDSSTHTHVATEQHENGTRLQSASWSAQLLVLTELKSQDFCLLTKTMNLWKGGGGRGKGGVRKLQYLEKTPDSKLQKIACSAGPRNGSHAWHSFSHSSIGNRFLDCDVNLLTPTLHISPLQCHSLVYLSFRHVEVERSLLSCNVEN